MHSVLTRNRVWCTHIADKNYEWQITIKDGDLLLITDHTSDPGWWEVCGPVTPLMLNIIHLQGCVLRFGADLQAVEISEVGWVPGHPSFYSPVILDSQDITQLMRTQQAEQKLQHLVSDFIKGNKSAQVLPCALNCAFSYYDAGRIR